MRVHPNVPDRPQRPPQLPLEPPAAPLLGEPSPQQVQHGRFLESQGSSLRGPYFPVSLERPGQRTVQIRGDDVRVDVAFLAHRGRVPQALRDALDGVRYLAR